MAVHRLDLIIEAKEDETIEGVPPGFPAPAESAEFAQNLLADVTKHEAMLGWRVTRVQPVAAGTVVVSTADLRHVLDQVTAVTGPYADAKAALLRDLGAGER